MQQGKVLARASTTKKTSIRIASLSRRRQAHRTTRLYSNSTTTSSLRHKQTIKQWLQTTTTTAAASRKHSPGSPSPQAPPQAKRATLLFMQSTVPTRLSTAQVRHISLNPRRLDPRNLSFKRWRNPLTLGRGRRRDGRLQRNWRR
jgi:hypothetical protein